MENYVEYLRSLSLEELHKLLLKGLYEESHKPFVMEIGVYKK
jgi:hypothetical protein